MRPLTTRSAAAVAVLLLVVAACGDDGAATTSTAATSTTTVAATTSTAPTTTTSVSETITVVGDDGVESEITDASRIVSLSGDLTEILFALGEGDRVVAIDVTTTYPEEATALPVIGFGQMLAPEPVLALQPTVVLANDLTAPPEAIEQIRGAGVPVVVLATGGSFDAVGHKIRTIAEIAGVPDKGQALAQQVDAEIEAATSLAAQADSTPRVAFIYSRGPQLLLLFGIGTGTNAMIEGANAIDVGAEAGIFGAVPVSAEALIAAAPDVIVLPEAGLQALGGVDALLGAIPGLAQTPAGQNGAFLAYDEAYFFNLGPRVGQALMEFVLDLHPELAG
ncbi:MAG TPA: ABC transporter substrate-binding protein [Acidimicrobiia bacterium]|nr:ABC transporter substrate-binding protein [Acidimicrobiia bacterium]